MSVYEEFRRTAARYGSNPFLHIPAQASAAYHDGCIDFSYAEMLETVDELRAVYARAGYGHGHRVSLVLENRAEFFMHFLALNALGASIVPVNHAFRREEMRYLIEHSDSALVVSLPEHLDQVRSAAGDYPIVTTNSMPDLPAVKASAPRSEPPGAETETAMMYTSGTTGKPKGCMLSNEYFIGIGRWYVQLGGYCTLEPGAERIITPLPLVHMNALACSTMGMIASGGCVIQLDRFHASSWWQSVRDSRATALHYLGVMPAILLNLPETPHDDFGKQIKFGFGAGVDPKHQERFEQRFGFPLIEGWAMTETGTAACIVANRDPRHVGTRCFGKPTAAVATRIVDDEGRTVPPGQAGELLVRAAGGDPRRGFFSGYYKDPQATEQAWAGGWFHTGDIVRTGEDGSYHFVDRKKNIVRRSGENIAAAEVEGVLFQAPEVDNCAVSPVPDDIRGEEVLALIVLKQGIEASRETAASIFGFCKDQLAYYKAPAYVAFVSDLPTTPSQKVQRGEIRKLAAACIEGEDCFDLRAMKSRR